MNIPLELHIKITWNHSIAKLNILSKTKLIESGYAANPGIIQNRFKNLM